MGNDRASVIGHVMDTSGTPIAGATVALRLTGELATTGSDGAFILDVPANTTLTLSATAPTMASTLLSQFVLPAQATTAFEIPLMTREHLSTLAALGSNKSGGVVAMQLRSVSGASHGAVGATIEIAPANLGKVVYAPVHAGEGLPDPDLSLTAITSDSDCVALALGVQPHVTTMTLHLRGASQVVPPFSIDDVIWPGTFTVDAGALTMVTLFTP